MYLTNYRVTVCLDSSSQSEDDISFKMSTIYKKVELIPISKVWGNKLCVYMCFVSQRTYNIDIVCSGG